jgi:imidazolonepropionase-like amidohydrolase
MPASFLLKDITIFTGDDFIEKGYVAVAEGKIAYVGQNPPDASVLPSDASVFSMPGRTVIPGLIDAHVHGLEGNIECLEQSLRFGVTTVCDMHNDPHSLGVLNKVRDDLLERSENSMC